MVSNRNLRRRVSQSAQPFLGVLQLIVFTGTLAGCHGPVAPDEDQRMFLAVDLPPLTSDRASTGGI